MITLQNNGKYERNCSGIWSIDIPILTYETPLVDVVRKSAELPSDGITSITGYTLLFLSISEIFNEGKIDKSTE